MMTIYPPLLPLHYNFRAQWISGTRCHWRWHPKRGGWIFSTGWVRVWSRPGLVLFGFGSLRVRSRLGSVSSGRGWSCLIQFGFSSLRVRYLPGFGPVWVRSRSRFRTVRDKGSVSFYPVRVRVSSGSVYLLGSVPFGFDPVRILYGQGTGSVSFGFSPILSRSGSVLFGFGSVWVRSLSSLVRSEFDHVRVRSHPRLVPFKFGIRSFGQGSIGLVRVRSHPGFVVPEFDPLYDSNPREPIQFAKLFTSAIQYSEHVYSHPPIFARMSTNGMWQGNELRDTCVLRR